MFNFRSKREKFWVMSTSEKRKRKSPKFDSPHRSARKHRVSRQTVMTAACNLIGCYAGRLRDDRSGHLSGTFFPETSVTDNNNNNNNKNKNISSYASPPIASPKIHPYSCGPTARVVRRKRFLFGI